MFLKYEKRYNFDKPQNTVESHICIPLANRFKLPRDLPIFLDLLLLLYTINNSII